jgi:hypothetical protein
MEMSIKDKKQGDTKEYELDQYEFDFITALAQARNATYNQYQNTISTFLAYLAGSKWKVPGDKVVDFSLDEEKRTVTVSPHVDA